MINEDHQRKFKKRQKSPLPTLQTAAITDSFKKSNEEFSHSDQIWLDNFEMIVRKNAGKTNLDLKLISETLATSHRQLFRRVDQILGITPNNLVRVIRLQLAWEAIASGKYRTIKEVANIAGYQSRSYFSKLFREIYGLNIMELLKG